MVRFTSLEEDDDDNNTITTTSVVVPTHHEAYDEEVEAEDDLETGLLSQQQQQQQQQQPNVFTRTLSLLLHGYNNNNTTNTTTTHHQDDQKHKKHVHYSSITPTATATTTISLAQSLPSETLVHIFSYLTVDTILNVSLVCHRWWTLTELNVFWKPIFENAIFGPNPIPRYVLDQHNKKSLWKTVQERFDFGERMMIVAHPPPPPPPVAPPVTVPAVPTAPTTTTTNNVNNVNNVNNNSNGGDDGNDEENASDEDEEDDDDENAYMSQESSVPLSKRGRRRLYDMINRNVYEKYYNGQSTQYLHHLSTPLYYKTCYYYLHGYRVVGTRRYERQQLIQQKAAHYNEKCTTLGTHFLLYAVVPLSTLLFTLFMIGLVLKGTVGVPQFIRLLEENRRKKEDDPTRIVVNVNQYTDFWWILTFVPFFGGVLLWHVWLLQMNVKHFVRYLSHVRQNYKVVSYALIIFCYFTSIIVFSVLGMLALVFPYDKKSSLEQCRYVWIRKIAHNDLLLLSPIVAGIILVNFVWPLLQFVVYVIRRRGNCISMNCLRKNVFQMVVYGGGIVCLVMFIAVAISSHVETEEQKEKGGSKWTYLFQNLAFVPLYLIQFVIVGLTMFLLYRLWHAATMMPIDVRFKVRCSSTVLAVLILIATSLFLSFELFVAIKGLSIYLLVPMIPLPTVLCLIFYTVLYMKKVLFG